MINSFKIQFLGKNMYFDHFWSILNKNRDFYMVIFQKKIEFQHKKYFIT